MEFWVFQIVNELFFQIERLQKFEDFWNCKIWGIFGIFQIENFRNFLNNFFLEFCKLQILETFQIDNFWHCPNWKINKFLKFFEDG